jgi:glutamine cyclotransferase
MPFGRRRNKIELMKHKLIPYLTVALLAAIGCGEKDQTANLSLSPDAGTNYKQGEKVSLKVTYPADYKADSVVYLLDSARIASRKDSSAVDLSTDTLSLGAKTITAKVYSGGKEQEVSTNINLLAAKAPEEYTFEVVKTFPHDTSSFTEGLEYHDGVLYESDGGYCNEGQHSSLRKTDVNGKILKKIDIDCAVFAEGITVIDNKIIQLTYHERKGFVYDKNTLNLLSTFAYTQGAEGWGLCNDGKYLYNTTTGTNQILVMDKDNYRTVREIDVYDDKGPVNNLNELEYIDGLLYANIWQTRYIVAIDPKTGAVLRKIDFTTLYPEDQKDPHADVLNGIAWDAAGKRMFVTGKNWPHLYQIKIMKDVPPVLTKN